ncbi:hypothetical protein CU669_19175 [Paramagnetospirillum kuznetsovii]|uniref:Lipoprotein n=1 Tax=Paramagnetospirillum kuznetsovii TaxID=2053833 RepID=A0A364NTE7_9PROT|nr:hypothetical protein [Paramagnetospirillum kuznetsovii]RAU20290.1 hypothetical protein CU669_19175 [Paramagnetospirillum kuznetsovii]
MTRVIFAALIILGLLSLGACMPYLVGSDRPRFDASEYVKPLADGDYIFSREIPRPARLVGKGNQTLLTMVNEGGDEMTFVGGFVPLNKTEYFLYQVTDAIEKGALAKKKSAGETSYAPVTITADGVATWFSGPSECDTVCAAFLASHGIERDRANNTTVPDGLTRERLLAFYEELLPVLEAGGEEWVFARMKPVAK